MNYKDFLKISLDRLTLHNLNQSFSQEGEDIILNEIFRATDYGRFVDIGAFHPIRYSNTYALYRKGWRGVNIEATPEKISLFDKYRPYDINVNAGVSHDGGVLKLYRFNEGALDTFDESRIPRILAHGYKLIEEIDVPTYHVMDLLNKYVDGKIDLLDIDVEGLDEQILRDIDFQVFQPSVILAETFFSNNENQGIYELLINSGYKLIASTMRTGIYQKI